MFKVLRVSGNSLSPEYADGDYVLLSRIPVLAGLLAPGDVIAFENDEFGVMIKLVDSISTDGTEITVKGTHPLSVDSGRFGPVKRKRVIGKVIRHIKKPRG
jgi:phage repressor protein C with HTH and peptisase S24 domain